MKPSKQWLLTLEEYSIKKYPKDGKCKSSCFANGNHRVGTVPIMSVCDGGLPGDTCAVFCLECGKRFKRSFFAIKDQPRKLF